MSAVALDAFLNSAPHELIRRVTFPACDFEELVEKAFFVLEKDQPILTPAVSAVPALDSSNFFTASAVTLADEMRPYCGSHAVLPADCVNVIAESWPDSWVVDAYAWDFSHKELEDGTAPCFTFALVDCMDTSNRFELLPWNQHAEQISSSWVFSNAFELACFLVLAGRFFSAVRAVERLTQVTADPAVLCRVFDSVLGRSGLYHELVRCHPRNTSVSLKVDATVCGTLTTLYKRAGSEGAVA